MPTKSRREFLRALAAASVLPVSASSSWLTPAAHAAQKRIVDLPGVNQFIEMMTQEGFSASALQMMFAQMEVNPRVVRLMDAPSDPTKKVYWRDYRKRRLAPRDVAEGAKFMRKHEKVLALAEEMYGVPAEIIAAILGIETRYGKVLGRFGIARSLATLAFDYPRRGEEFRAELAELLIYSRRAGINPLQLRGSFAGAFGFPQFLPSSARKYAVDFNDDGRTDLFSVEDAAGSIANFLVEHGWQPGGAVSYKVESVSDPQPLAEATRDNAYKPLFTKDQLARAGVIVNGEIADELYLLVDLENRYDTEYRLGAQNFYALTRYNKSFKYASVVFDLSVALAG